MVNKAGTDLFVNPDYMAVQCWVHTTFLASDTVNQTKPHVYHYTQSSSGCSGPHTFGVSVYMPHDCHKFC